MGYRTGLAIGSLGLGLGTIAFLLLTPCGGEIDAGPFVDFLFFGAVATAIGATRNRRFLGLEAIPVGLLYGALLYFAGVFAALEHCGSTLN
jgi:hypothetical protein